ncbi:MAG: class I SAM-dependent methyltransferase [Kineothrix sp.]|nr:class I SAM-dependent methyltransferase [Kineothrix sp.]
MEAYTDFASVYDIFMDDTPYEEWASYIMDLLEEYGVAKGDLPEAESARQKALAVERNVVVDLGCGTGTLTELLADRGCDMIGIDASQEMLNIALEKRERSGKEILYLCQDMRELELYGTAGAVISVCDSLNYLLEEEEMLRVFRLVNNYLYPGGVFLFDFNTVYKYETVIGDSVIAENREDCSFIWENYYDAEGQINEYDLTIFARTENQDGEDIFRRFTETHYQRGYTLEEMRGMVEKAGMEFVRAEDADTRGEVREESERIYVIARECGKDRK